VKGVLFSGRESDLIEVAEHVVLSEFGNLREADMLRGYLNACHDCPEKRTSLTPPPSPSETASLVAQMILKELANKVAEKKLEDLLGKIWLGVFSIRFAVRNSRVFSLEKRRATKFQNNKRISNAGDCRHCLSYDTAYCNGEPLQRRSSRIRSE
jgi:hypothetical protein